MPSGNPVIYKNRKELIGQTEGVVLRSQYRDQLGNLIDTDNVPQITIVDPSDRIVLGPTSINVKRISVGLYEFKYFVELNSLTGVFLDRWAGVISGVPVSAEFNFIVTNTLLGRADGDGYIHLGDKPGYSYSQDELVNINRLMDLLRYRLNSSGLHLSIVGGNKVWNSCDIFKNDELLSYLILSLSLFNQTTYITGFDFTSTEIMSTFADILVQGALVESLGSKALIEAGRNFKINDQGINADVPDVAATLMSQYAQEQTSHREKLKAIKENFRSSPLGLSLYGSLSSSRGMPLARVIQNTLKSRQIF